MRVRRPNASVEPIVRDQVSAGLTMLALLVALVPRRSWAKRAGQANTYLLVWASDKATDADIQDPNFVAIIDADRESATYGKVVSTGRLQSVGGKHLLSEVGLIPGLHSDELNDAHHFNSELYERPDHHKYLFPTELVSPNILKCDVTVPLNIGECALLIDSSKVKQFTGRDEVEIPPNGNLTATYVGAKNSPRPTLPSSPTAPATPPYALTTPAGLVEFTFDGTVVQEHTAAKAGGPIRYVPSVKRVTNTGLLAHPLGIDFRPDLDLLITSDYADPWSLATSNPEASPTPDLHQDLGTTVRVWKLSNLAAGPQNVIQTPDGPQREDLHS